MIRSACISCDLQIKYLPESCPNWFEILNYICTQFSYSFGRELFILNLIHFIEQETAIDDFLQMQYVVTSK
jgi:hypothetical protein